MTHDTATIWICSDCIMLVANGETPPEMTEEETNAWIATLPEEHVTLGMNFDDHDDDCPNWDDDGEWLGTHDDPCETIDFSWQRCEMCERPNSAGTRHAATIWFDSERASK